MAGPGVTDEAVEVEDGGGEEAAHQRAAVELVELGRDGVPGGGPGAAAPAGGARGA